jgi:hypothetical protein
MGDEQMDLVYAPAEIAKGVTGWLKQVAVEVKSPDQLHLPDFLDVNPRGDHDEWNEKLARARSRIANATEGTADAQVKLCQTLTVEFKTKKAWRGLLNRLGRMQIEAAVADLARRKPGADILRSAHATHVHTLEFVVGSPDARKIVEEVFREKNLNTEAARPRPEPAPPPAPKPKPAPPSTGLIPKPRPVVAETAVVKEGSGQGGGTFWSRLGGILVEAVAERLDRRMDELNDAAESARRLDAQTPSVAGEWYAPNGGVFTFSQVGSQVSVHGAAAGVSLSGRGQIRGKSIQIHGLSLGGGPFQAGLAVSADGKTMSGQVVDGLGRSSPVQLRR